MVSRNCFVLVGGWAIDIGAGVAWDEDATFNAQQGIKMETVEDWARKNLER